MSIILKYKHYFQKLEGGHPNVNCGYLQLFEVLQFSMTKGITFIIVCLKAGSLTARPGVGRDSGLVICRGSQSPTGGASKGVREADLGRGRGQARLGAQGSSPVLT